MPAPPYFLDSERLSFRPWSLEDLPLAQLLWGDFQVTRFFGGPYFEETVQRRLDIELANESIHHVQYWPMFLKSNAAFVGCAGLRPYQPERQVFELGFHLRPDYWRKGLATEAAATIITYAFDTLGVTALFAGHYPENIASRRVLEKLGFRFTHEEPYAATGKMHLCYLLSPAPGS